MLHLKNSLKTFDHVAELLLFFVGEGVDHGLHFAGGQVGHFEDVFHQQVGVDQTRPGEDVNKPLLVEGHLLQPILHLLLFNIVIVDFLLESLFKRFFANLKFDTKLERKKEVDYHIRSHTFPSMTNPSLPLISE